MACKRKKGIYNELSSISDLLQHLTNIIWFFFSLCSARLFSSCCLQLLLSTLPVYSNALKSIVRNGSSSSGGTNLRTKIFVPRLQTIRTTLLSLSLCELTRVFQLKLCSSLCAPKNKITIKSLAIQLISIVEFSHSNGVRHLAPKLMAAKRFDFQKECSNRIA